MMDFTKLGNYMDSLLGEGVPGVSVVVRQNHKELYRHEAGVSDLAGTKPVTPQNCYWLYSATKVLTCTCAMQLVEAGKLDLDAPLYEYIPAWKNASVRDGDGVRPPKRPITIRHLFAMQGGLNYDVQAKPLLAAIERHGPNVSTRQMVDALAEVPLCFDPGDHFLYSLCHDVLGAVIEVVSNRTLGEYMREHLIEPCGMTRTTFHPDEAMQADVVAQYDWDESAHRALPAENQSFFKFSNAYESGGGGLASCASDYIRFADALACGGVADTGARVLRPETIDLMRTNLQFGDCLADFRRMKPDWGYGYGYGVRTLIDASKGSRSPLGEFGWDGAGCVYALIDPTNRLSVFFGMEVLNCLYGYNVIHPTIRDLVYEALI